MADATHEFTNRLIHETSPYLLQHAHNPVDWCPWGADALARAQDENKPIFLSIGYAACHWCHVMERESFENPAIAEILNRHFVSIKVDREERPDLDDLYMQAVQLMTGSGGWPMSMFLTPLGRPFFGGTYFPPEDRYGHPGFRNLLLRIVEVYTHEHDKILQNSEALTAAIIENTELTQQMRGELHRGLIDDAIAAMRPRFDSVHGGFGGAPKFPPSMALNLLLREYSHSADPTLRPLIELTLRNMAAGGMYDQLGGGFHRYSTDAHWLVPHFEKMLYDNALLAPLYFDAALALQVPAFEGIGREILDWMLAEMHDPAGGFHSTLDADSEGVEGKYYTWQPDEVLAVLTAAGFSTTDAERFATFYDITPQGNWHEAWQGGSILNRRMTLEQFAAADNLDAAQVLETFERMRRVLLAARVNRVPPGKDDKILASWNGLTISALARGAQVTGEPRYLAAARAAADFVLTQMRDADGNLQHSWRAGLARVPGLLEDYACLLRALVDLYAVDFDTRWLGAADQLAQRLLRDFHDPEHGGFFSNDGCDATVLVRMKDYYDGATPSGNSVAVQGLLRLGLLLDKPEYLQAARATLAGVAELLRQQAPAYLNLLCALADDLSGWSEVAILGNPAEEPTRCILNGLWRSYQPALVTACAGGGAATASMPTLPLLVGKVAQPPEPTIYVCRNYACGAPLHTLEALLAELAPARNR
jgi:uncharacterized protein YyaL (SSP411 family)